MDTARLSVATWNLNHRVGKTRFQMASAHAVARLKTDIVVLTEFYPRHYQDHFCDILADYGLTHQIISAESPEKANRVLIASQFPLISQKITLPQFDFQFPSNIACVTLPQLGFTIVGLRIPAYRKNAGALVRSAWDWIITTAQSMIDSPSLITGDFNVSIDSTKYQAGRRFHQLLSSGWQNALPAGLPTYFGINGKTSAIDHALVNQHCTIHKASVITETDDYHYAGRKDSLSDHGVLVYEVSVKSGIGN